MGFRISWLAVEAIGKERLLGSLDLVDTGEPDGANQADWSIAELPNGWCVLWSNDQRYAASVAPRLSREFGSVMCVSVNETCMHMTAVMFDGGERRWRVHHEGDQRVDFLETEGSLPASAAAIEARLRGLQVIEDAHAAAVDYLADVPLEIAKSICGYKHDEMPSASGEPVFTAVTQASLPLDRTLHSTKAPSFWQRFIGRAS